MHVYYSRLRFSSSACFCEDGEADGQPCGAGNLDQAPVVQQSVDDSKDLASKVRPGNAYKTEYVIMIMMMVDQIICLQAALPPLRMSTAQMDTLAAQTKKMLEELEENSEVLDPNLLQAACVQ